MEAEQLFDAAAWVGRQQAFALIASKCSAAQAQCLRQIRETRSYEQLGLTWEEFCEKHAGISRVYADTLIRRLEEFGETYFKLSEIARVSPETYREIAGQIHDDTIDIDGVVLALIPENASRIRAGIQRIHARMRRLEAKHHHNTVEFHIRQDALLKEVSGYASHALGLEELFAFRNFTAHAARKWRTLAKTFEAMKPL